ncbi:MAG TPA: DNA polymerase III subunit delta' [Polyangia bacterium]|nr:DNA polymerase III subunit delta' [Polyangia bacterium]
MRLADLIGQDLARAALERAIAGGRVAHAYVFEGPPGVGKRSAALGLAMALNCPVAPGAGCGACEVCRRIDSGLHPDVPSFGPSGPGGQIIIDDIRAILALTRTRPHEARARVIVVDDADAMNPSSANGLLKTLEEPLGGNHLVLCTGAPDRLLPTVRSRAQRIRFRALSPAALAAIARARGLTEARAEIAVALADGSAARMLEAVSAQDGDAESGGGLGQALGELRRAVSTPGAGQLFDAVAGLTAEKESKADLPRLVALLGGLYRDAMAVAAGAPELATLARVGDPQALAALGLDRLGRAVTAIVDVQLALQVNVNPTLALERLLIALKRQERQQQPEARA